MTDLRMLTVLTKELQIVAYIYTAWAIVFIGLISSVYYFSAVSCVTTEYRNSDLIFIYFFWYYSQMAITFRE